MRKNKLLTQPIRLADLSFDDIDDDNTTDDWRLKAERLQARRWRKLKQGLI